MTTITTRASKGSPLSWSEVDANFTDLNTNKIETSVLSTLETTAHAAATYETIANVSSLSAITVTKDTSTGAVNTTNGTTAQRPTNAVAKFRYNSTDDSYESYTTKYGWGSLVDGKNTLSLGNSATTSYNVILKSGDNVEGPLTIYDGAGNQLADFNANGLYLLGRLSTGDGTIYPLNYSTQTASGSSITFSSIPSWVQKITLSFLGVSATGAANIKVQIGNGTIQTTGYTTQNIATNSTPAISLTSYTDNIHFIGLSGSGSSYTGQCFITKTSANDYICTGNGYRFSDNTTNTNVGSHPLGSVITDIKLLLSAGTFDAGTVTILYE